MSSRLSIFGVRPSLTTTLVLLGVLAAVAFGVSVPVVAGGIAEASSTQETDAALGQATVNETVSESSYEEAVPEQGDPYYEAEAKDGSWISYVNPRDEYRSPYLGDGSGKICVTLLNEGGDVVAGETAPNTTVEIPTGDSLAWHSQADPWTVEFPLTEHYERPLDADQFGTHEELPQGDGWLDTHCLEWHGLLENATVSYGAATIEGEHADAIEVVGYIQQAHEAWDSDVDPIEDAGPYEEAGGWTYETDESHGQAVVVLQLNRTAQGEANREDQMAENQTTETESDSDDVADRTGAEDDGIEQTDDESTDDEVADNALNEGVNERLFGIVAIVALVAAISLAVIYVGVR